MGSPVATDFGRKCSAERESESSMSGGVRLNRLVEDISAQSHLLYQAFFCGKKVASEKFHSRAVSFPSRK